MKIIFLDIDGVCNTNYTKEKSPDGFTGVEQRLISKIKRIIDATGARIVLTSTWRMGWNKTINSFSDDFKYLKEEFGKQGIDFFDRTSLGDSRGEEIEKWLNGKEVDSFVILDDELFDIKHTDCCKGHMVKTSMNKGITDGGVKMAIQILNKGEQV